MVEKLRREEEDEGLLTPSTKYQQLYSINQVVSQNKK